MGKGASGWPTDGDDVLVGNHVWDSGYNGLQTTLAGTTQKLYPRNWTCNNVAFPIHTGYISQPTLNGGECDVHNEITKFKVKYDQQDQGDQDWLLTLVGIKD